MSALVSWLSHPDILPIGSKARFRWHFTIPVEVICTTIVDSPNDDIVIVLTFNQISPTGSFAGIGGLDRGDHRSKAIIIQFKVYHTIVTKDNVIAIGSIIPH